MVKQVNIVTIPWQLNDNDLLLNKQSKFTTVAIVVTSFFEDQGKVDPQVYLD